VSPRNRGEADRDVVHSRASFFTVVTIRNLTENLHDTPTPGDYQRNEYLAVLVALPRKMWPLPDKFSARLRDQYTGTAARFKWISCAKPWETMA